MSVMLPEVEQIYFFRGGSILLDGYTSLLFYGLLEIRQIYRTYRKNTVFPNVQGGIICILQGYGSRWGRETPNRKNETALMRGKCGKVFKNEKEYFYYAHYGTDPDHELRHLRCRALGWHRCRELCKG